MSYPPPLYDGATGEVSARVHVAPGEADLVYPNGTRVTYLASGASTGGLFGLYRWDFAGPRSGPGAHFHRTMAESFYVLEGEVSILDGHRWVTCRAGDFAHVPPGGIHGFSNESGPASMLLHFAPGAPREAYFEGLARHASGERMTAAEYDEFMREHDNHWVTG
jgi:mannose-6-phosphate isomerase-like protein (cupin superfamily)